MDKRIEHEAVEWAEFCREVMPLFKDLEPVFGPSSKGVKGKVLRLKIPYGTRLIEDGQFQWQNIPKGPFQDADFAGALIPLGLVLSRTIELYDTITIATNDDGAPEPVRRSIPLFLLPKGNFFGLFQAFCDDFKQPLLQASAGGTTLVLIPRIGNIASFRKYAINLKLMDRPWDHYADNLKSNLSSGFYFGRLFADIAALTDCDWRLELVLFPIGVVESLRKIPSAHECLLQLTLNQMRVSHERSESTIQVLRTTRDSSHMQTARMIARGLRPGFSPVFASEEDTEVLPARVIYDFIYGNLESLQGRDNGAGKLWQFPNARHFYPAVFRPSFMDESSFYFLNWPYRISKQKKNKVASHVHLTEIAGLKKVEPGAVFDCADRERLVELLRSVASGRKCLPEPRMEVKLGEDGKGEERNSHFIEGGVVYIARASRGEPPC